MNHTLATILTAVHLLSLMFWIGSMVSITRVMTSAAEQSEAVKSHMAAVARKIYRSVSSPWMGFALLSGLGLLAAAGGLQLRHGWFHGKLTAVIVMLALHFYLGAQVRGAEKTGITADTVKSMRAVQLAVLLTATIAVSFIVVWKGLRPGV